jgi:phenylacetate-CoA ligase
MTKGESPTVGSLPTPLLGYLKRSAQQSDVFSGYLKEIAGLSSLSREAFHALPFMSRETLYADVDASPPFGSFYSPRTGRICLSPGPRGLTPVHHSIEDLRLLYGAMARAIRTTSVRVGDRAAITFGYHVFVAGLLFQGMCDFMGLNAVPLGPGEAERSAALINHLDMRLLIATPSFALRLAEAGATAPEVLLLTGEPLASIPGMRERLKGGYGEGTVILEMYGLAEIGPVAMECAAERGMHIFDDIHYVEIIDPDSGQPVGNDMPGELVITPYGKDEPGVARFRTGDMARIVREPCECGCGTTIVGGVLGQLQDMYKVKGVKLYAAAVRQFLAGQNCAANGWRVVIDRIDLHDRVSLILQEPPSQDQRDALSADWRSRFLFRLDDVGAAAGTAGAQVIEDLR